MSSHCASNNHIHCQNCSISELCLPFSLNEQELDTLDNIIDRKRPIHKGEKIFQDGEALHSLFAIRSGTFKTFTIDSNGEEQITGFHLAGDLLGFDALASSEHQSFAQALETSMVCEIPYHTLDELSNSMPALKRQVLRLMSNEIRADQDMLSLLNRKNAEQRLATFLSSLSSRYKARGLSASQYRLTMTRGDIGNYIGLTVETISRLLNRFHKQELIIVEGKLITINDLDGLNEVAML
ncbi:fumarate/nitrate reduction transcriptional regulator Fnr [Thalassotalea euphylliae]|uniref:Fumarate/nitrate reduction transcriptional regulator Fnr n=1 Tax=Thalassotalea euphylliae TaxID=1655234 RepID=A0A3E0UJ05_9GAMM|nr:fumarate/nitrate reduction transcriptional regulator Fnr [Thalassotalea euphylliae]REL29687.1 fumarate/nitrate reduction transcriptional regulator Fnr [Thalassotalea euphylliae]REL35752.1 fumarate/nitrate reduction transcriptional regulator Fnr [Thalassotalea euphylliae]